MKITCESCGAKYTIADDKVRGRKVKIRCKGCGTPIVVDGSSQGGVETASDAEPPVSVEPPANPSGSTEFEWSVNLSDTEQVTLTTQQIIERWHAGQITSDAFVWREGMSDWKAILECVDLAPLLAEPARVAVGAEPAMENLKAPKAESTSVRPAARAIQPRKSSRPAPAAARVTGGRAQGGHDLFATVDRTGSDDEEVHSSAPALPQAGTARGPEEKATGARNENSVLFSLDALKAGFSGSGKPEPPKQPSTTSDDPFGMGNAPALAGLGGGGTLSFSLSDNQNLLNAPPPPEPPAPRIAPAVFSPGGTPAASPKRTLLFVGLGVGLLAVGLAVGIGLSGGGDKDKAGENALAKTEEKPSETAKAEEKKEEPAPKAEEPKAEEAKKEEEPAKDPTQAEEAKAEEAKAEATKPSSTGAKSGGGTRTVVKKETAKVANQPFNKGAAVSALSAAANNAASCKKIGGPTGTGKVQVTFAPSGRVTSATAGPPFAGTTVGGCIASVFRKATVPPFTGSALTVAKSVTIR